MSKKTYVRAYDVGRVVAYLQSCGMTVPQMAETCGIHPQHLASTLHKYRHDDKKSRVSEDIAHRLYKLQTNKCAYAPRAHATDAQMRAFRSLVDNLTASGMTYTHIARETGLDRKTIRKGMSETLTCESVRKLLASRDDLLFDTQNGFGKNRAQNRYAKGDRESSYRKTIDARYERDAKTIRAYLKAHPSATRTRCARDLDWSPQRVINVDARCHLFDERSKKRPIDDEMVARYLKLKRQSPKRSDKSIANELGISQKSTTKIRKTLANAS